MRCYYVQVLIPSVDPSERLLFSYTSLPGVYRTVMRYGYMDRVEHDAAFTNKIAEQACLSLLLAPTLLCAVCQADTATHGNEEEGTHILGVVSHSHTHSPPKEDRNNHNLWPACTLHHYNQQSVWCGILLSQSRS